jgi:peroxiredoxin
MTLSERFGPHIRGFAYGLAFLIAADGDVGEKEVEFAENAIRHLGVSEDLSDEVTAFIRLQALEFVTKSVVLDTPEQLEQYFALLYQAFDAIKEASELSEELLAAAHEIIRSDGTVTKGEERMLASLETCLNGDPTGAVRMLVEGFLTPA